MVASARSAALMLVMKCLEMPPEGFTGSAVQTRCAGRAAEQQSYSAGMMLETVLMCRIR